MQVKQSVIKQDSLAYMTICILIKYIGNTEENEDKLTYRYFVFRANVQDTKIFNHSVFKYTKENSVTNGIYFYVTILKLTVHQK